MTAFANVSRSRRDFDWQATGGQRLAAHEPVKSGINET